MYEESEYLMLSGLQHMCFCPRQCAFIHVEQLWSENYFTAEGHVLHEKVHGGVSESRKGIRTERNLRIASSILGIMGQTDAIEFYPDGTVIPIEYKHGDVKKDSSDRVQLCAQVICLEEMLNIHISNGALFYFKTHRRQSIKITDELRIETLKTADEFHKMINEGITPPAVYSRRCESCSFLDDCFPSSAGKRKSVLKYLRNRLDQEILSDEDL